MSGGSTRRPAVRFRAAPEGREEAGGWVRAGERPDTLAVEEPLEIRVDGTAHSVTMRTPGHDLDLALGYLLGEGVLRFGDDVLRAEHCPAASTDAEGRPTHNAVDVRLRQRSGAAVLPLGSRGLGGPSGQRPVRTVSSACGICGTGSIDDVRARAGADLTADAGTVSPAVLTALPERLRQAQRLFDRTGGVHAAGLFTADGTLVCAREDVGRHNAVDKVVGWALSAGRLPLRGLILQVSGRASFELAQKAWAAGCPVLSAVSAPSSLAVDLATDAGMTLVGFSRPGAFTVYAGAHRIAG